MHDTCTTHAHHFAHALQRTLVKKIQTRIEVQVKRLADVQASKGCGTEDARVAFAPEHIGLQHLAHLDEGQLNSARHTLMWQIYLRPDEGTLNSARVIYRAKEGRAVGQLGANCKALFHTPPQL